MPAWLPELFLRVQLFPRVLDHRDRLDLDIGELAIDLFNPANIALEFRWEASEEYQYLNSSFARKPAL